MSLQATHRCDQAHPYQRNLKVGISLFGRETPAYILEEVGRRQSAERGTSSLWAKLAADYGPRHANFIVKHDTKFPITRNDRNSWSNIAQAYTDKKRIRPSSAPNTRREVKTQLHHATANNERNAENGANTARGRLVGAARNGGETPMFQRTQEVQAVVDLLRESRVTRLKGKLKKGERKKAARMAEEARRIGIVLNSVVGSSAADRESSADRHEERSHQSSLSAANSIGTSDGRPRSVSGDNKGGRRRRPKPASHNCIPTNPQRGSTVRQQPASNARSRGALATTVSSSSSSEDKRPRSAGSRFMCRKPADPDGALGLTKTRSRIYCFGVAGTRVASGGGAHHREGIPRAVAATDVGHRVYPDLGRCSGGPPDSMPGRGRDRGKSGREAGSADYFGWIGGKEPGVHGGVNNKGVSVDDRPGCTEADEADTGTSAHVGADGHLGAIDISKLTTVLSHAGVCGSTGAMSRMFLSGSIPGVGAGERSFGSHGGSASERASNGDVALRPSTTSGRANDGGEAGPPVPETRVSEDSGTESDEGDNRGDEEGSAVDADSLEPKTGPLGGSSTEGATVEHARTMRVTESAVPGRPGTSSGIPQHTGCSKGRYARAENKSKSAYAARRAAAAAAVTAPTAGSAAASMTHASTSLRMTSVAASRDGEGGSRAESGASKARAEEGRKGGERGSTPASSWRRKFAAVQKRRLVLEDSMRAEAERLVEIRAKKEARISYNASVSTSVSVRGAKCFLGLRGGAGMRKTGGQTRRPSKREPRAATVIQRAFRNTRQYQLWLGEKYDRDYVSKVVLEQTGDEGEEPDAPHQGDQRCARHGPAVRVDEGATYRAKKLHDRHVAVRTKRMVRGFICCTQARVLLLQLLWDKIEGSILGERRSKRAAAESRAAATIQQLSHIRRIAVGLIKMQSSANMFKMEHQSKQAKRTPRPKSGADRRQGGRNQAGGERTFEAAKQARSEKAECEAILREHGRRGRRLVATAVRDRVLRDMLYSYRRQHIIRDQTEYLLETSRPPFVDSRDIKRMLACPAEEMHKFSDPKNYRTRPRFTRLALPLREIEGAIQDVIASHVKSEYRDKLKEALGAGPATDTAASITSHQQHPEKEEVHKTKQGSDCGRKNDIAIRPSAQGLPGATAPTAGLASPMVQSPADQTAAAATADAVQTPPTASATATATATATKTANEEWGRRRRGGVAKVEQVAASTTAASAAV